MTSALKPKPDALARIFPERRIAQFIHRQDRMVFFSIVNELVKPDSIVLDFGAGRNRFPEFGRHLNMISTFKGRCARVIGVDVDPIIAQNDSLDQWHMIGSDGKLPLEDDSVDLIFSYAVLEHLSNPEQAASEIERILKPGGWFCAWTPNKWGYIAIASRLIPENWHAPLLKLVQPGSRGAKDVFPTFYRSNTLKDIAKLFPKTRYEDFSFTFNAQPSYNFGKAMVARFWMIYMSLVPRAMAQGLFVFVRKLPLDAREEGSSE